MAPKILYGDEAYDFVTRTKTPQIKIKKGGKVLAFNDAMAANYPEHLHPWARRWAPILANDNAFVANSFLDKREWAELDRAIYEMAKLRRNGVQDLLGRNLVKRTTLAEMLSQFRMASERIRPSVNMDGRSRADRDRTERVVRSVPVPIIRTDYEIGRRELLASRKLGSPLDTFEAGEAASAVAEEQERMLFLGDATVVVHGASIPGYTNLAARDTGTAAAYGGGDFGTISNIVPTFLGMLAALAAKRYHGPFVGYVADAQYHEMLDVYTDGSGQTALARATSLPQILEIKPSDFLTASHVLLVQMTPNVVDLVIGMDIENREWMSPDEQALYYAVLAASAPRLKTDYAGNAGIAHATGA